MANPLFRIAGRRAVVSGVRNVFLAPALSYRDFRLLCVSSIFNSIGFMGENVALGWVLLQLTNSPFLVAAGFGVRMAPSFFLGLLAGAVVDRVDRHKILRALNISFAVVAGLFGALLFLELIEVWHIFVLTFIGGGLSTSLNTARQSYAYDVVGPTNVLGGLSFLNIGMRAGAVVGSLSAGFIIARTGADVVYFTFAGGYVVSTLVMLLMHSRGQSAPTERQKVWENLKEFGVELRLNGMLRILVVLVAVVEIFGFSTLALLPSLANDVLNVGADGLGVLNALSSIGGIAGIVVLSSFGDLRRKGLVLIVVLHFMGAGLILLGFANSFVVATMVILVINATMALSDILSQSIMQIIVRNELRGRSMGAWAVAVGFGPLGNLQVGALASALGVGVALTMNGFALVLAAVITLLTIGKLRRL